MAEVSGTKPESNSRNAENDIAKARRPEGYLYASYGPEKYLKDAVISALTLKRYDKKRPVALACSREHRQLLESLAFETPFDLVLDLDEDHQSIVGYKHNIHHYMPFERNLYLDSDMIWCRNPEKLWLALRPYAYTITGQESADVFFGSHKNIRILVDILLRRRQRTLRRFGLTSLTRVQTGVMYAADPQTTLEVNKMASEMLKRKSETHFVSRKREKGRNLESCEWSLGMAVTMLNLHVYPWFNAQESIQLDFIRPLTKSNSDYSEVSCKYYCNPFVHSLRGIRNNFARTLLFTLFRFLPRGSDHLWVTPYILHFGWKHQKPWFDHFVNQEWNKLNNNIDSSSIR
jgi:hypothetical protein